MNIDIKNVFRLELRDKNGKSFSNTRLKFMAEFLSMDADFLVGLSSKYKTIWFTNKENKDGIYTSLVYAVSADVYSSFFVFKPYDEISDDLANAIKNIDSLSIPNTPKQNKKKKSVKVNEVSNIFIEDLIGDVELDVDTILDKISNEGMSSLTKRELEFLNNLSK